MTDATAPGQAQTNSNGGSGFVRGLSLFDAVLAVAGAMIGSGIFIVSADMSRHIGSAGGVLVAWALAGVLTVAAALSYGELAAMMPHAGGMYIYLREAFSPLVGFLYGWTFFAVIQGGTIAAVAVAFARFTGVLVPFIAEDHYLIAPLHISSGYAVSLSTAQLLAIASIILLTWTNARGLKYGKIVQTVFTTAKTAALVGLIVLGIFVGRNSAAISANFTNWWTPQNAQPISASLDAATLLGFLVAICVVQTGSLFAADSWHDVTFVADEVQNPERSLPLALGLGAGLVVLLYFLANVAYFSTLPIAAIQQAPSDRVATATLEAIFPGLGAILMAIAIMVSTFGCNNTLILAGARAYYAMAKDKLFFKSVGTLNKAHVPGRSLLAQGIWASMLVLPRTFDTVTGKYGNLYSNLLDYIISSALIFYILTIAGVFRLRKTRPDARRPYRAFGHPIVPALYILGATAILVALAVYKPSTTWPGFIIVLLGLPVYALVKPSRQP
jgi:basic amino acid/polyamine antiporter, APA family